MTIIRLSMPIDSIEAAAGDETVPKRTIAGVAVPWDVPAVASSGPVMFLRGSLPVDGPAPKLIRDHDPTNPIGIITDRVDTENGMRFTARISDTVAGTEALTLAADGVLDSVSVGVDPIEAEMIDGVLVVAAGRWLELSLLPFGAFASAKLDLVAASAGDPEPTTTTTTTTEPESEATVPDEEITVPTPNLRLGATPARITAADFISATLSGQMTPAVRAAAAEEVVSDIPGLVPDSLVGPIWDTLSGDRPIITALGTYAMPAGGESFYRRKVTAHTTIEQQLAEFDELGSSKYTVERIQVDKKWLGGELAVSEQAQAYADSALLDLIIMDMSRQYARATELYVGQFVADNAGTASTVVADWLDGDEIIEALYAAAAEIKAGISAMPTHLVVSSSVWAKMGAAKDTGGNRIFPFLAPSNAAGTMAGATSLTGNPLGLQLVVSDDILVGPATEAALILNGRTYEVYEERRGALRVEQPGTLSTLLAFRGMIAAASLEPSTGALSLV